MSARRARGAPAWLLSLALVLALFWAPGAARSHELDSASLSLTEVSSGRFLIRWHASSSTLQADLGTAVVFPKPCRLEGAYLECGTSGLVGLIEFPWIGGTLTPVMVDVQWQDGMRLLRVLSASSPRLRVYGIHASGLRALEPIAIDYTWLGVEHILTGFDHLLFVVALALLVRSGGNPGRVPELSRDGLRSASRAPSTRLGRPLVTTITAFTLAHSLSLALTVLGLVRVPGPPVEASIALSIVLVCAECLRPADSLARRAPWAIAFAFGLLHGLGFASALLDLGVPEQHVPAALFCFNVGVELGQLGVIAVVIGARLLIMRLRVRRQGLRRGLIYAIGGLAAFWSLDRIGTIFNR